MTKIEYMLNYYERRLQECIANRDKVTNTNIPEDTKTRLYWNWTVRINMINEVLLMLRYDDVLKNLES